ncbi:hypothetical protein OG349_01510 [Streptomyces sp. NBC_01317]|uniref:hypothetical protein n=1 Tax=Streptomyces sp. NBC_01317 TaxID=2903822 RepID=UPI002E16532A|nr:hypothetical protein OG349_01510 [Streptomyces sp. NBC_01317]
MSSRTHPIPASALDAGHHHRGHQGRHPDKLPLTGPDLSSGRLTAGQGLLKHTVHLDELSHRFASEWLAERYRRWPAATNTRLLISP